MSFWKRYFYTIVPLFSDITAFYCILQLASFGGRRSIIFISFPYYLLLTCAVALINCLLTRKEHTLVFIVAVNAAAVLCTEIVMFSAPHSIYGVVGYAAAAFMFLYPAARSAALSRRTITLDRMMRYCEMSVMGTGVFIAFQLGYFHPDAIITPLCLAAMLLNLLTLSTLRLAGSHAKNQSSGVHRTFILSAVAVFLFAAAVAIGLLVPACKDAIIFILGLLKSFVLAILRIVKELVLFLVSLIPARDYEALPPEPGMSYGAMEAAEEAAELPMVGVYVLFFILCAAVITLLIYALYRFRRLRLRALTIDSAVRRDVSSAFSFTGLLIALLKKLIGRLSFYLRLILNFNTYSGVFVRLELSGRRYGHKRSAAQTPREFLTSLIENTSDYAARSVFAELAGQIDMQCFYAGGSPPRKMESEKIKLIFRTIKLRQSKRKDGNKHG